jgi:hypothetical protein
MEFERKNQEIIVHSGYNFLLSPFSLSLIFNHFFKT